MGALELEIRGSFDVRCEACGTSLVAEEWRGDIIVSPCSKCMDEAREEGSPHAD